MQKALLISLSALALTACGQGATNSAANTAAPEAASNDTAMAANEAPPTAENSAVNAPAAEEAAPAATNAATPASTGPAQPPVPRAGLWEVTTVSTPAAAAGRAPRGPIRFCSDGVTAFRMGGQARSACEPVYTRTATGFSFTSSCTMGPGIEVSSHGTSSGDNDSFRSHSERDVTGAPMPAMNGHHVTNTTGHYVGPCPPTMPPGSIEIGGRVITREQMAEMRGQRGGGGGGGGN